ncbi:MAG TPA: hypothetical protein VG407_05935 [Caulobacteraceae bacterium]|jgi:hypothetical protein|nr:hypothetical protein [Caulobacteraceae bacterium]
MAEKLRRLIDLPGVAELETKALMKPSLAEPEARDDYPEIDACLSANFGLTAAAAEAVAKPATWDGIERKPPQDQVIAFEAAGWDVTDNKRRPLRMLAHYSLPLWLAVRGVAGTLPFVPDDPEPDAWGGEMAAAAKRFRKDRR